MIIGALTAIEEAGYAIIPRPNLTSGQRLIVSAKQEYAKWRQVQLRANFVLTPKSDWSKGLEGLPTPAGSRPTYAELADSATSFDPEKQFEKDRE